MSITTTDSLERAVLRHTYLAANSTPTARHHALLEICPFLSQLVSLCLRQEKRRRAHTVMLAFAMMSAPALRSRWVIVASSTAVAPTRANDPQVVGRPTDGVQILSFIEEARG